MIGNSLARKFKLKLNANEDESIADLQMSATLMISIGFPSLIIHEFDNFTYHNNKFFGQVGSVGTKYLPYFPVCWHLFLSSSVGVSF